MLPAWTKGRAKDLEAEGLQHKRPDSSVSGFSALCRLGDVEAPESSRDKGSPLACDSR